MSSYSTQDFSIEPSASASISISIAIAATTDLYDNAVVSSSLN